MGKFQGSKVQVVQTVGKGIPQKWRTQQKYDKRPGEVKIFSPAEILEYVNQLERLRVERESVKPQRALEMSRHCGPNPQKHYNI